MFCPLGTLSTRSFIYCGVSLTLVVLSTVGFFHYEFCSLWILSMLFFGFYPLWVLSNGDFSLWVVSTGDFVLLEFYPWLFYTLGVLAKGVLPVEI